MAGSDSGWPVCLAGIGGILTVVDLQTEIDKS